MALQAWMRIGQPLEPVMADYQRTFDAWAAGGVRGLVLGRLLFADEQGQFTVPAVPSNPQVYRERGLEPKARRHQPDAAKEKLLHAMLDDAKARGWPVLVFEPRSGGSGAAPLPLDQDPYGALALAAVWEEVFTALPQADGGIMDGWTEADYELISHHGGSGVFGALPEATKARAAARGYDVARLQEGIRHLYQRFHRLTAAQVRYYGACGMLSGMNLFDLNEDAVYWLRWRREQSIKEGAAFRAELDKFPRRLLLGNGVRSAVFSGMTGLDFHAWGGIVDLLLIKHYFWHRGFDGLYGTVARWVKQIHEWNPELAEQDCFTVVAAWLGVDLPGVESLADMELGFPPAFFDQIVTRETARAIAAVGDAAKIMPWVDTGREPHGGDPMTAGDLYRILTASEQAGLRRFLFHNHVHLTAAEWGVISRLCGTS